MDNVNHQVIVASQHEIESDLGKRRVERTYGAPWM